MCVTIATTVLKIEKGLRPAFESGTTIQYITRYTATP